MSPVQDKRDASPELELPILTYRVPGPKGTGPMWIARSVATGHVGQGRTEEAAIDGLLLGIDLLLAHAESEGLSPVDWHAQQSADPEYLRRFERAAREGAVTTVRRPIARGGCRILPRKAVCQS